MAVCYFNNNYKKKYDCYYEVDNDEIIVNVDYEIHDEIRDENGIVKLGPDTTYERRDILIIDNTEKKNYLLKDASYIKYSSSFGTPDSGTVSTFKSNVYLEHKEYNELVDLPKEFKVEGIKIYTDTVNQFVSGQSVKTNNLADEIVIHLRKEKTGKSINVNNNNIKTIAASDEWEYKPTIDGKFLKVELKWCLEIELIKFIKLEDVWSYIMELIIFLQLITPNKTAINGISIRVGKKHYFLHIPINEIKFSKRYVKPSVEEDLLTFLKKCYKCIPYRLSENEIRNIPYIILKTSRNLEDNFLMFYRFIECYYKKQKRYNFIEYAITHNYKKEQIKNIEDITSQIISLRNHYVHSGYYIKNKRLEIVYKKINGRKNKKDYFEKKVDAKWIYERTKILYDIVIDIIFFNMLGYSEYEFDKHF